MLEYARLLAPGIVHKIEHPYSNDFSGLSGDDCRELGQILAENIESGEAERWWEHYQDHPQWTEMFGSCPSRESFLSWMSGFRDFLLECDGLTISRALEWSPPTHWANAFSAHDPALEHVSNNQLAREVAERLGEIQELVESAFERVHLLQQRKDLEAELDRHTATNNGESLATLEKAFVKVVAPYSDAKGISYSTWREVGVPAEVLSRGGIARTRG